jgi:DNA-binding transcriptional LysR family regulator
VIFRTSDAVDGEHAITDHTRESETAVRAGVEGRARQILNEVAEVEDDLLGLSTELKGSLRVQALSGLGQKYLTPQIAEFFLAAPLNRDTPSIERGRA